MEHPFVDDIYDVAVRALRQLRGEVAREEGGGFRMKSEMRVPYLLVEIGDRIPFE